MGEDRDRRSRVGRLQIFGRGFAAAIGLAVALAASSPGPVSADPEPPPGVDEIELRLKTAGVPEADRLAIRAAIAKGAAFLIGRQRDDGAILDGRDRNTSWDTGTTALAALALVHSGLPDTEDAARKALDWLAPEKGSLRLHVVGGVYEGGIVAMLLAALDTRPELAHTIVDGLVAAQDGNSGWWAYCTRDCKGCPWGVSGKTVVNLSTAQFGALGLWAGGKASHSVGPESWDDAWELMLDRALVLQTAEGSWSYQPAQNRASPTPTGTAMGMANLWLAAAACRDHVSEDVRLAVRVERAKRLALERLDQDVGPLLEGPYSFGNYGYYALEKACVFAGVERVGGRPWYLDGARRLVAGQFASGAWSHLGLLTGRGIKHHDDVLQTAFALLFLLRVSETYRPTTPRDVPRARGVVTPSDRDAAPDARPPAPLPPERVLLSDALGRNAELERQARRRPPHLDELLAAIRAVDACRGHVVPDTPSEDIAAEKSFLEDLEAWRASADRLLGLAYDRCDGPRRDDAEAVAVAATQALARGGEQAASELRGHLPRPGRRRLDDLPSPGRYDAALVAVGGAGGAGTVDWLADQTDTGNERWTVRRTRAALAGLAAVGSAPGVERRKAVWQLLRRFAPLCKKARTDDDDLAAQEDKMLWAAFEERLMSALRNLARDPATGEPPPVGGPGSLLPFEAFRAWFEQHDDEKGPPWLD